MSLPGQNPNDCGTTAEIMKIIESRGYDVSESPDGWVLSTTSPMCRIVFVTIGRGSDMRSSLGRMADIFDQHEDDIFRTRSEVRSAEWMRQEVRMLYKIVDTLYRQKGMI